MLAFVPVLESPTWLRPPDASKLTQWKLENTVIFTGICVAPDNVNALRLQGNEPIRSIE
jgi:hypothetical protein